MMFERYTEKARRVIFFGRLEASRFGSPYIESEHLLLGLVHEDLELVNLCVTQPSIDETFRELIRAHTPQGPAIPTSTDLPLSNESKRILTYAAEEAQGLGHHHIGTEHLLLGLLREEGCFAARLLRERGAVLKGVRKQIGISGGPVPLVPSPRRVTAFHPEDPSHADNCPRISFETYSEKARRSIFYARYEASRFGAAAIETEHLLLGMWREAAWAINGLIEMNDPWESLRGRIEEHSPVREAVSTSVDMPLSEELQRALMYAAEEAGKLGCGYLDVEHLLLGLLREDGCFAARMLRERGADLERIRARLRSGSGEGTLP
jgi:ATP-dependent Clp protease ATP-binding subunit ClpA